MSIGSGALNHSASKERDDTHAQKKTEGTRKKRSDWNVVNTFPTFPKGTDRTELCSLALDMPTEQGRQCQSHRTDVTSTVSADTTNVNPAQLPADKISESQYLFQVDTFSWLRKNRPFLELRLGHFSYIAFTDPHSDWLRTTMKNLGPQEEMAPLLRHIPLLVLSQQGPSSSFLVLLL